MEDDSSEEIFVLQRLPRKIKGVIDFNDLEEIEKIDFTWRRQALCRNNPDFIMDDFFYVAVTKKNIQKVLQINALCRSCPVAANCLYEALIFNYDGVWAGTTLRQRRTYLQVKRDFSVENLTLEECEKILKDFHEFDSPSQVTKLRYKRLKNKSNFGKFLNTKSQTTSND